MKSVNHLLLGCKRGQWLQLTFIIVVLVVLAFIFIATSLVGNEISDSIQDDNTMSQESKDNIKNHMTGQDNTMDSSMVIIIVLLWLLILALAYNSQGNPLLLVIALFILVSLGFVGMILSNTWEEVATTEGITSSVENYPITNFILNNYLILIIAIGFSGLIVAMSRGGGF